MTNWVQQHILLELTRYSRRRFSELRPDGVESNLFLYHLNGLLKSGLITKVDGGYELTDKGKQQIGRLSLATGKQRVQPQILTAVVCQNDEGEYLWYRWRREPNVGLVSIPHGMLHFGETVADAAARELSEKAGLRGKIEHLGEISLRYFRDGEVLDHKLVQLCRATKVEAESEAVLRTDLGESYWAKLGSPKQGDFVPGFYEISELVKGGFSERIFEELKIEVD